MTKVRKTAEPSRSILASPTLWRAFMGIFILALLMLFTRPEVINYFKDQVLGEGSSNSHGGVNDPQAELSTVFTPEVLYWHDDIIRWSLDYDLNPNLVATIIQIESCGNSHVLSPAGAQGLFQVMPFHFADGENQMDIEINAVRGLNHLDECLRLSNYDVGIAFACYNGGGSVTLRPQSDWAQESRDYLVWGSGIYRDATNGAESSATLQRWLDAGGSILCGQARTTQSVFAP